MHYHFGVKVLEGKYGLNLTREKYAIKNKKNSLLKFSLDIYEDKEGKIYSDEWCDKHLKDCLENYDLNMSYFSLLNHDEFIKEINNFLDQNTYFKEVFDLNSYDKKSGYYIIILDKYCQAYIGTTDNIKRRIRQHWTKKKSFDKLLFPMGTVNTSMLSIDSFRALDTTRIFVYETKKTFDLEDSFINQFSSKFLCNRIAGGRINDVLFQSIIMKKKRNLK